MSWDCRPQRTQRAISIAQLTNAAFTDAKVMGNLVCNCAPNLLAQRCQRGMGGEQRTTVQDNAVRGDHVIALAALGEGDAFVQAKKLTGVCDPSASELTGTRPVGGGINTERLIGAGQCL